MTYHIFTRTSGFNSAYVKLFTKYFNMDGHVFVFRKVDSDLPDAKNIIIADTQFKLLKLVPKLIKAKHIYFQFLPIGPSLYFWYCLQFLMKKSTWVVWGADLYFYRYKDNSLQPNIYEYIRKELISKISRLACLTKGDYEIAKEIYGAKGTYKPIIFPNVPPFELIDKYVDLDKKPNSPIIIQLGNSATETNNHFYGIGFIPRLINSKIICPLTYGDKEYAARVIKHGKRKFGNNFKPLTEFMPPEEYVKILSRVDIGVFLADRQQAFGNIYTLLYLGKKVFINEQSASYQHLLDMGIKIFKITDWYNSPLSLEDRIRNHNIIKQNLSEERFKELWGKVLGTGHVH